jgi:hypothetical protein
LSWPVKVGLLWDVFRFDFSLVNGHSVYVKATEVTVQLPTEEAEFLEAYAKERSTSVAEIFTRYARRLQNATRHSPSSGQCQFFGVSPKRC